MASAPTASRVYALASEMRRPSILALIVAELALGGCGESHDPMATPGGIGAACSGGAECMDGLSCVRDARYPGGYCTRVCEDGECPSGASCDAATSPPFCLSACGSGGECREGYQCWRGACRPMCASDGDCATPGASCGTDGLCIGPECATDGDCGAGRRCAAGSCEAVPLDAGTPQPFGEPCARGSECESGVCLDAALGGFCTRECAQPSECGGIAACGAVDTDANGDGTPDSLRTLCVGVPTTGRTVGRACASDAECEARLCQSGQCTEVCNGPEDCLTGQSCVMLTRASVPGASFLGCGYAARGSPVQIDEHTLGELDLGAGFVTSFGLAAPPDAVSITFQARRVGGDPLDLTFYTVEDPTETTVFDVNEILMLNDQPERWLPFDTGESISMLLPNTSADRLAFVPGAHQVGVGVLPRSMGDTGRARVRVTALVKRAATRPVTSGTIDLNVFLVGVGVTAAAAPTNTRLQGALTRLESILTGRASISIGAVDYFEITGDDATRYSVIDSTDGDASELSGLFRLSAARTGRRLNVFLVRSISSGGSGFRALGVAGGIPGPVAIHGTQHSGVVAAFDPSVVGTGSTGANVIGHVLSHEIGHYLGLFHATEQARPCGPGETPEDGCAPFGAGDTLADTTRGDTSNLMYWSIVGSGSNDRLSAGQAFVLRLSALATP